MITGCDDYPAYKLVQVRFPTGPKLYTYLYPASWPLKVGHEVRHPGMYGPDWGRVINLNRDIDPFDVPTKRLYVLTDWRKPQPPPPTMVVRVPRGVKLEIVELDEEGQDCEF